MSAFPAPSYYFTGIGFNSAFYTTSTTIGLTQSQANALYLLKNTADTATALETFNSGISTNSIATTTSTSNLLMYPNQTSGGIYLGVNVASSTGRTGVIHIGDGNSLPSGANIHINNGTNVASNVNILNGTGSTGTINLGCATSVTNCNSNLTMGNGKNINLQNALIGYVAPTVSQLGGFISVPYSVVTSAFTSAVDKVYGTYTLTQAGYYLMVANCINYSASLVTPYAQCYIYDTTNSKYIAYLGSQQSTTNSTMAYSVSGFYYVPASTNTVITVSVGITFSSGSATAQSNPFNFNIIRIA